MSFVVQSCKGWKHKKMSLTCNQCLWSLTTYTSHHLWQTVHILHVIDVPSLTLTRHCALHHTWQWGLCYLCQEWQFGSQNHPWCNSNLEAEYAIRTPERWCRQVNVVVTCNATRQCDWVISEMCQLCQSRVCLIKGRLEFQKAKIHIMMDKMQIRKYATPCFSSMTIPEPALMWLMDLFQYVSQYPA